MNIPQAKKVENNIQYKNKQIQEISYAPKSFSKNTNKILLNENNVIIENNYQNNKSNFNQNKISHFNQNNIQNFNQNNISNYNQNGIYQLNQSLESLYQKLHNSLNNITDTKIIDNINQNQYFNYSNKSNYSLNIENNVKILPTLYSTEIINPIITDNNVNYLPLMNAPTQYSYYSTEPKINQEQIYYNNINDNESYFEENYYYNDNNY